MKAFMDQDFLLNNETAKKLFHEYADRLPIIDYHCHLEAKDIYEDIHFDNITQVWLGGDHYKWRIMRANGIEEKYILGEASDEEKFLAWASTLQKLIGNPLYHFSHLELQRYFGVNVHLTEENAKEVYEKCNKVIKDYSARKLIEDSNVELLCTTDDPTSDLKYHKLLKEDSSFKVKVLPAFRPDKAINISKSSYKDYIKSLQECVGYELNSIEKLVKALKERIAYFAEMGCRTADHGLDFIPFIEVEEKEVANIYQKALQGISLSNSEAEKYMLYIMKVLAKEYSDKNWIMQLHYGAKRDNSTKNFNKFGPDTGFDAISDQTSTYKLNNFLNALQSEDILPKTIVYSLNPVDNASIVATIACFQESGVKAKIQQGSAWWFNDQKDGMIDQMKTLAGGGILANFVGMLTDSRSFLSYARHEYFRRILCNLVGEWVENGEYPNDEKLLKEIVEGVSYKNVKEYFEF